MHNRRNGNNHHGGWNSHVFDYGDGAHKLKTPPHAVGRAVVDSRHLLNVRWTSSTSLGLRRNKVVNTGTSRLRSSPLGSVKN